MKKVIVIGAGVAGLSAAIYARRSGFEVTVCEQHSITGGMCTSWRRRGYLFEGAVHWLTGSSPKTEAHQLWKETGALSDSVKVFLPEPFRSVEWEGRTINLYRDIEKTAQEFLTVSPEDVRSISRLVKEVKALSKMGMPIFDVKGVKSQNPKRMSFGFLFKMLPALPKMSGLNKISCKEYAGRFTHPAIQRLLSIVPEEYTASSLIFTLASLNAGDGGYSEGGALGLAGRMTDTFTALGGKLLLRTRVKKVNIENGAAVGVTLEDGTVMDADAVIVTQETIAAVERLFDTPPGDAWLKELCENTKSSACTFVSVGIRAEITQTPLPEWTLDEPITYAGRSERVISFNNYYGYKGYAPEGCTALTTAFIGDTYDFWKKARDEGRYEEEKRALADQISRAICKKYPQAEGNIEVIDVATPLTYERYTGAHHGSWMSVTGVGDRMKNYPGFSRDVSGLYFAGHRLMSPGGLPVAVATGRQAAQMVCRQFDVVFK